MTFGLETRRIKNREIIKPANDNLLPWPLEIEHGIKQLMNRSVRSNMIFRNWELLQKMRAET